MRQGGLNFCSTVGNIFDLRNALVLRTSKRKTLLLPRTGFSRALEEKNMDFSISDLLGSSSPQNHVVEDRAVLSSTGIVVTVNGVLADKPLHVLDLARYE